MAVRSLIWFERQRGLDVRSMRMSRNWFDKFLTTTVTMVSSREIHL
jgi:hypothetical protein